MPALQLRVALVVIAWAVSEPLLLEGEASPWAALGFGLLVTLPLLFSRRGPLLVVVTIAVAYLVQFALDQRMEDAMSPELALAFGLFGVAAYAQASWLRPALALALAASVPLALWVISELDLGRIEAVAPTQYLYLTAVAFAGVLPGLALRSREAEVERLDGEIQSLYVRAANEVGASVDDERRTLGRELVRVVEHLVDEIRPLVVEARRELTGVGPATAGLGRRMADAAREAADELRGLLHTLTGGVATPPPESAAARRRAPWRVAVERVTGGGAAREGRRGLRDRVDLRGLAGLVFPVAGLAALCVADRIELPALPLTAVTASGQELTIPASAVPPAVGYALAALTPCGLLLRRRAPVLAVAVVAAFLALRVELDELSSLTISQVFVCGALAYNAGAWPRRLAAALLALAIALAITAFCWYSEQYHFAPLVYAYMVAVLLGTWLVGRAIRDDLRAALFLRDRAAAMRAQRDRLCRAAVDGQRRDVARELHDVVGHGLSLIVIQAGVVDAFAGRDRDRARDALGVVEAATHSTQAELAALRTALDDGPEAPGPSRSCSRTLERIVEEARRAGQPVLAYVDPRVDELPPDGRTAIVRIAQEALTNARKHAGGAATTLEVDLRGDRVRLAVHNDAGAPLPEAPRGSQLGLRGMSERAESQGGTFTAGPEGEGWTVRAELPRAGVEVVAG
ncbi:MAG TPA: histidine kinase [Solirubrobacterales bacterium]|nr:histidine kinase [Solirubrobacterales bacterium]